MAISNANAQSVSTKTVDTGTIWVQCDGVWDVLSGTITTHYLHHNGKNGFKVQLHAAELVSLATGEVFRMNKVDKMNGWGETDGEWTWHIVIIGDKGTHAIAWVVVDVSDGWMNFTQIKVKCQ